MNLIRMVSCRTCRSLITAAQNLFPVLHSLLYNTPTQAFKNKKTKTTPKYLGFKLADSLFSKNVSNNNDRKIRHNMSYLILCLLLVEK